jgi:hypothetical protein
MQAVTADITRQGENSLRNCAGDRSAGTVTELLRDGCLAQR